MTPLAPALSPSFHPLLPAVPAIPGTPGSYLAPHRSLPPGLTPVGASLSQASSPGRCPPGDTFSGTSCRQVGIHTGNCSSQAQDGSLNLSHSAHPTRCRLCSSGGHQPLSTLGSPDPGTHHPLMRGHTCSPPPPPHMSSARVAGHMGAQGPRNHRVPWRGTQAGTPSYRVTHTRTVTWPHAVTWAHTGTHTHTGSCSCRSHWFCHPVWLASWPPAC